ncbi:hypothetical protein [[Scytonema hofmanni] UTEX B 1581]|uniref:hypothetical protein n=1 Tax=[Scytonema hofmanni] UTEX B 1581 TaxID=379535 RepID=UPI000497B454|nr:hypothetical protein [[Scytonema hofmanni] UTEX B 1581]
MRFSTETKNSSNRVSEYKDPEHKSTNLNGVNQILKTPKLKNSEYLKRQELTIVNSWRFDYANRYEFCNSTFDCALEEEGRWGEGGMGERRIIRKGRGQRAEGIYSPCLLVPLVPLVPFPN